MKRIILFHKEYINGTPTYSLPLFLLSIVYLLACIYIYAQNLAKLLCNPSESLVRFYIILVSSEITNCI